MCHVPIQGSLVHPIIYCSLSRLSNFFLQFSTNFSHHPSLQQFTNYLVCASSRSLNLCTITVLHISFHFGKFLLYFKTKISFPPPDNWTYVPYQRFSYSLGRSFVRLFYSLISFWRYTVSINSKFYLVTVLNHCRLVHSNFRIRFTIILQ